MALGFPAKLCEMRFEAALAPRLQHARLRVEQHRASIDVIFGAGDTSADGKGSAVRAKAFLSASSLLGSLSADVEPLSAGVVGFLHDFVTLAFRMP